MSSELDARGWDMGSTLKEIAVAVLIEVSQGVREGMLSRTRRKLSLN